MPHTEAAATSLRWAANCSTGQRRNANQHSGAGVRKLRGRVACGGAAPSLLSCRPPDPAEGQPLHGGGAQARSRDPAILGSIRTGVRDHRLPRTNRL